MNRDSADTIEPGVIYPLGDIQRRLGGGPDLMRQLRRKGLKLIPVGKRRFVHGTELIDLRLKNREAGQ